MITLSLARVLNLNAAYLTQNILLVLYLFVEVNSLLDVDSGLIGLAIFKWARVNETVHHKARADVLWL